MLAGTPGHVWRIILMEGMERFSYYGFRAILTLYFVSLDMRESSAAAGFMFTSALAYAAPLVGAPNLILTPHIAGVTAEGNVRVSELTVQNVIEALS